MALHQELSGTEIHTPFAFVYATEAARTGATGLTSNDEQKLALQTSDSTVWVLTNFSGPTWARVGKYDNASELLTAMKTVDGSGSGLDADMLDGKHASEFANADHTHSGYVTTSDLTSKAPIPTSSSGVGQWCYIATTDIVFLPSGGTWVYYVIQYANADGAHDGVIYRTASGIGAGGMLVLGSKTYHKATGFAWRIS